MHSGKASSFCSLLLFFFQTFEIVGRAFLITIIRPFKDEDMQFVLHAFVNILTGLKKKNKGVVCGLLIS